MAALRIHLVGVGERPYAEAPIIATSAVRPRGLIELRRALAQALADTPPPPDIGKPRLFVDRSFTLRGVGTIVTGTLSGGWLRRGQTVVIQPEGRLTRIRGVQSHHREIEASGPGTRTALNLADVDAVTGARRGAVVTLPEFAGASRALDVLVERSARVPTAGGGAGRPLCDRARVRVHLATASVPAQLRCFPGEADLFPGAKALARLELETGLCAWVGDRLVIR